MNNSTNPAQGTIRTVAGASSQGSVSDVRACFTFSYPGPFKCQACEHVEAVFAGIVNHCTHHNVLVNGLTMGVIAANGSALTTRPSNRSSGDTPNVLRPTSSRTSPFVM
ncbi:hypothetical protein T01_14112 [Trichinella spiralis]|uniref:Uncharacterized protein n=1 Tax=Trichinella spiralis TaxID=6334 RepID=A0A0V1ATY7_TRISP|nr:hypothetical protein T01_14112 [Trichinella spiralis]